MVGLWGCVGLWMCGGVGLSGSVGLWFVNVWERRAEAEGTKTGVTTVQEKNKPQLALFSGAFFRWCLKVIPFLRHYWVGD